MPTRRRATEAGLLERPPPSERSSIEAAQRQLADKLRLVEQETGAGRVA